MLNLGLPELDDVVFIAGDNSAVLEALGRPDAELGGREALHTWEQVRRSD